MSRLPKSPEDKRATKAARQARWRANRARKDSINEAIDFSAGVGPRPKTELPPISTEDLNVMVRDRMRAIVLGLDDDDMLNKDYAPGIALGLKAQVAIDNKAKVQSKNALVEVGRAWLEFLNSGGAPMKRLDDGKTIDGEFTEVDDGEAV